MSDETPQDQEQEEVEATTPPADEPAEKAEEPTVVEVQERTEAAVQSAGQPTPDENAPGYGDEPEKDTPDQEGVEARRVSPDEGGYQFTGNESGAEPHDESAE